MTESLPVSRDIDRMRKELEKVSQELRQVSKDVKEVDRKVDRSNATQLGTLATALAADSGVKQEILLYAAGMSTVDIARVVGKSQNAVKVTLSRAGLTPRKKKASANG